MSSLKAMTLTAANCTDMSPVPESKESVGLALNLPSKTSKGRSVLPLEVRENAPPFLKIISELQSLSTVMQTFIYKWEELQKHLDFVENAIQSREKELLTVSQNHQLQDSGTTISAKETETVLLTAEETTGSDLPGLHDQESEQKTNTCLTSANFSESHLETLCRTMCSRELRKYILTHLSQASKLRKEVPAALKGAQNPAKLVLDCIGKFYLQGRKAFTKNSSLISSREAALLILECFLLMDRCNEVDQSVNQEAEQAALAWRKRLITESGLFRAGDRDARGLLLFVACFGIPNAFTVEDLAHLLKLSSARDIKEALRKSTFLLARIPDIIERMKNIGMDIEAVDTVYIFGIEDKFSQKILAHLLRNLKEECKRTRNEANGSPLLLKEAHQKQLDALKSVLNCLEAHKVDPAKVLPGWKLSEKITNLQNDIAELNRQIAFKRKGEEQNFRVVNDHDLKRSRINEEVSMPMPSPFSSLQEPRVADPLVYQLGSRYSDPINSRPAAPAPSWRPEYAIGMGGRIGVPGASFEAGMSSGSSLGPSTVSSVGLPSDRLLERNFLDTTELRSRVYVGPSSYGVGSRSSASDLYRFPDAVLEGDYARRSYMPEDRPAATSFHSSFL